MKKLILTLLIVLTLIMCSCQYGETNETEKAYDIEQTDNIPEITAINEVQETYMPEVTPADFPFPRFWSEQEFAEAIKNEPDLEVVFEEDGTYFYFAPENVPEDVILTSITVMDDKVIFLFDYEDPHPNLKSELGFVWYTTEQPSGPEMEHIINKMYPKDFGEGQEVYPCHLVFWNQHGYQFTSIVPIWFTDEDYRRILYC